jgi:hypothetical protein
MAKKDIVLQSGEIIKDCYELGDVTFIPHEKFIEVKKLYRRCATIISSKLMVVVPDEFHTEVPEKDVEYILGSALTRRRGKPIYSDYVIKVKDKITFYVDYLT